MSRRRVVAAVGGVLGAGAVVAARNPGHLRPRARKMVHRASHRSRYVTGHVKGMAYRVSGRHPDEHVDDLVLADRVRSEIGPLTRALDLPHVHVMVNDHQVKLHGDVATEFDAATLGEAVLRVSGVRGVRSYLHVGMLPSDTRPSEGQRQSVHTSKALEQLLEAARSGGAATAPLQAVRAVLGTFFERLPQGERAHVLVHLPADVRGVAAPPQISGSELDRIKTAAELYAGVVSADTDLEGDAPAVITAVLACLADLVPEERDDIAAVLPEDLRTFWLDACLRAADGPTVDAPPR